MNDIFRTLCIAIVGGVAVYYFPKLIKALKWKRKPILLYQFDDDGSGKVHRRVYHSFGVAVEDKDASNGRAWEHTSKRTDAGHATCYGPYTKEIPFSGKYKARFRIKAVGIKNNEYVIILLDITHGERRADGKFTELGLPLAEKEIRGKELPDGKYKDFDVEFQYDGQSLIEFRCAVPDPENYQQYVDRVLFDNVKVFKVIEVL
jgi:hypothetical protein